jgi:asparagine synthase (glutamine-hydrolysing)
MFRYVALVGRLCDPEIGHTATSFGQRLKACSADWRKVHESDVLQVYCAGSSAAGDRAQVLANHKGVVLGDLFRKDGRTIAGTSSSTGLDDAASDIIVATEGRQLINAYWGNYVAFIRLPSKTADVVVVKDPSGNLPCLTTNLRGITVIFSCPTDCVGTGLLKFTVNWEYVRRRVAGGVAELECCPLNEVEQVHRGQAALLTCRSDICPEIRRQYYWTPLEFSDRRAEISDVTLASELMRDTFLSCMRTWAASHRVSALRLSGGLDSSIVLGCLSNVSDSEVFAYSLYTPGGRSDERRWARLAAEKAKCTYHEYAFDPLKVSLDTLFKTTPTFEPVSGLPYLRRGPIERALCREHGCSAVFSGEGGDSGFGREAIDFSPDEYIRRYGPRLGWIRLANSVALHADLSVWTVLGRTLRRYIQGCRMSDLNPLRSLASTLVSSELRNPMLQQSKYPHPWFAECGEVPWPTVLRLGMLLVTPEYYDPLISPSDNSPEHIPPLYSQPMVELCLRIPTYLHFAGGRDRAIARRAFNELVPEKIIRRHWKDRAPGWFDRLAESNMQLLREVLLKGNLMKERMLDSRITEEVLLGEPTRREFAVGEIFNHFEMEIWIDSWRTYTNMARAA